MLLKYINRTYFISVYLLRSLLGLLDIIYIIIFEDINFNNLNFTYKDLFYIIEMTIISYLFIYILNKSSSVHSIVIQSNSSIFVNVIDDIINKNI